MSWGKKESGDSSLNNDDNSKTMLMLRYLKKTGFTNK